MASRDLNAPNILVILSDDQGAWAMGGAGNEEIVTPNLIGWLRPEYRLRIFSAPHQYAPLRGHPSSQA